MVSALDYPAMTSEGMAPARVHSCVQGRLPGDGTVPQEKGVDPEEANSGPHRLQ